MSLFLIKLNLRQKRRKDTDDSSDHYSLTISIVIPKWPSRFQNSDFKDLLKNIIILNSPVYVHIDFIWLDIDKMIEFESVYFSWLRERVLIAPKQPDLDDKAIAVLNFLQQHTLD